MGSSLVDLSCRDELDEAVAGTIEWEHRSQPRPDTLHSWDSRLYCGPDPREESLAPSKGLWAHVQRHVPEAYGWELLSFRTADGEILASHAELAISFEAVEASIRDALVAFYSSIRS